MIETEKNGANRVESAELTPEFLEKDLMRGAEMLESPQDGNFVMGLQVFVAWVKDLFANHK
ncbi:MAG: hypothetical protein A2660_02075 [Candidatus Doudnabacteria bacterium RIFCSPHIGHO2_01_FULL_45_18]|uniref:Uncharacterized protein n=1 Tax=Candidatus Doudnabacteria bacterium RIFCSPHIGHO2_01_FULL_45_18 TaxID=1817823 RepID=A0A1F5NPZ4_9BACT|nr:MAG: hypothetical protein A2660_02075 [Candidatus Doudnabacteria bacterium RIFCSPHIGHO2_01_FULL_45_18]